MSDPDRSWEGLIRAAEAFAEDAHTLRLRVSVPGVVVSPALLRRLEQHPRHVEWSWIPAHLDRVAACADSQGRWASHPRNIHYLWKGHPLVPPQGWLLAGPPE